ncbi:DUF4261 domain-containing protein [Achromobacter xylosoxidans]|uniref:DUF4261 domain-containing protein n=1 Tax=Alcaligenes xylosoxydans xylosoxydans TaxID=85698 RepID=UPI0006C2B59F|nr:DUF4261 domain-containing protein [Achromobacter xylosoxidans]CUJ43776.1 Uncharacterised protein [Achromobacter xylosoxidans]
MSIFSRFFGRAESSADTVALTANPDMKDGPSLQVVFAAPLAPQADALAAALCAYHPEMREARAEIEPDMPELLALVGWGKHVVRLVGFNAPFPQDALEACVAPAHYPAEVKEQVRNHASHALLYYAGFEEDPLEQYVALAAVAGALTGLQAVAVLNEDAHTSLPAGVFSRESMGAESLELLRSLPLNMLYCGFVKYEVEGVQGVWMRTYGAGRFGLPDFAVLAEGHHQGEQYSNMFNNIMAYLLDSGAELAAGHTMQIGEDRYMRLREPLEAEYFLHGPQAVLVTEIIDASQINKPADAQDD